MRHLAVQITQRYTKPSSRSDSSVAIPQHNEDVAFLRAQHRQDAEEIHALRTELAAARMDLQNQREASSSVVNKLSARTVELESTVMDVQQELLISQMRSSELRDSLDTTVNDLRLTRERLEGMAAVQSSVPLIWHEYAVRVHHLLQFQEELVRMVLSWAKGNEALLQLAWAKDATRIVQRVAYGFTR
jgi:DNA repair ATPase RecN